MAKDFTEIGEFGPIYRQFEKKPREAIRFLMKKKNGEFPNALYREDIGFVDIVWGNEDRFGLSHIIKEHEKELEELHYTIDNFIPIIFSLGIYSESKRENKIKLETENFLLIIKTKWNQTNKRFVMSAFDLRPIHRKNPKRAAELKKKASKKGGSL